MKDQINTIRCAVEAALSDDQPYIEACQKALTALAQIEAAVGEQEPVAWRVHPFDYGIGHEGVYATTHLTQQRDAWLRKGWNVESLYTAAPVAQQPGKPRKADVARTCPFCNEEWVEQPQAEAVPVGSVTHDLKLLPEYFAEVQAGTKTFELRKDDRGFNAGDSLRLREWSEGAGYTGKEELRRVLGVLRGPLYGLEEGFVILSTATQQAEAVQPGYVLVPVEPTEAMLLSARDWSATKYGKPIGDDAAKGCWGAMVAAAITQQKGGV